MAATGIFYGLDEADLLAIRAKAVAAFKRGLTVVSYTDSSSSVSKQWTLPPRDLLAETSLALYALDPLTYKHLKPQRRVIGGDYSRRDY